MAAGRKVYVNTESVYRIDSFNQSPIRRLAERGWRLFPVKPRDKQPLITDWPHQATCDEERLRSWLKRFPDCNWGVATGPESGVFVLDVDGEPGLAALGDLEHQGYELPPTLMSHTGRGSHIFLEWPSNGTAVRNSAGKIAAGLDVRGAGGYVIVPPSVHSSGAEYRFHDEDAAIAPAPQWLLERLAQTSAAGEPTARGAQRGIDVIPDGQRNQALMSLAGTMQRKGMTAAAIEAALLAENKERCNPPLSEAEVRKIACSVSQYEPAPSKQVAGIFTDAQNSGAAVVHCDYGGGRFEASNLGVVYTGPPDKDGNAKPPLWICGPLRIVAMTRDQKSSAWGRLLEWSDSDGVQHQWAMPLEILQGDGVDMRSELARQGLSIAPGRLARDLLASFLQVYPIDVRARCVDRIGWDRSGYVLPTEAVGEASEKVVFQNAHAVEPAFSVAGTAGEWRKHVAALAQGNSCLILSVSAAFAGSLLEPAGEDSGGFHLRGRSSTGKSTALKAAASVWGNPASYCRLWRSTSNGLEGLAALHNDGLLILDELSQIDPREAGEAAYLLANGRGKNRAARNGTARQAASWRLLFLSAGEESLSALMARAGRKSTAGQEIRMAEIDADAGADMGALEDLHGFDSPAALVVTLRDATSMYYGAVGAEWLRLIVEDHPKLPAVLSSGIKQFAEEFVPKDAVGQVERVARRFGLVATAGEMASRYGLTGWAPSEAVAAVGKCFDSWLDAFGGTGNREERALLSQVRGFFEQHGASRFEHIVGAEGQRVINRAGFYRTDVEGHREYLVLPEAFRQEVCGGFDHKGAIQTLIRAGWLIPASDGNTQKPRLPELGTTRVYVFGAAMWGEE